MRNSYNRPLRLSIEKCKVGQIVSIHHNEFDCKVSVEIIKVGKKKVKIDIGDKGDRWVYPDDLYPTWSYVSEKENIPDEILDVYKLWEKRISEHDQTGLFKMGAKFEFEFRDRYFSMKPPCIGQCDRWEYCLDEIEDRLYEIGCKHVYYDYGYYD